MKDKKNLIDKYSKFEQLHDLYNKLSDDVKKSCQSYFGNGDSISGILFNLVNIDNIEYFWQYIADSIKGNKLSESQIEILKKIFDIAFDLFQIGNSDFVRLEVNVGDGDNPSFMQKTLDSKQLGSVIKVCLPGYKLLSNNRAVKKSLILLG